MIGQRLLHYEIIEVLGQGGMGTVYKARDTRLNRLVALKVFARDRVRDADKRQRFMQEAQAASSLNHPHIVTIYDIGQADGDWFIAMEYVPGQPLSQPDPAQGHAAAATCCATRSRLPTRWPARMPRASSTAI